jgi:hypothetical protein
VLDEEELLLDEPPAPEEELLEEAPPPVPELDAELLLEDDCPPLPLLDEEAVPPPRPIAGVPVAQLIPEATSAIPSGREREATRRRVEAMREYRARGPAAASPRRPLGPQKLLIPGRRRFEMTTRWMFPVPSKMS